jgi:hypothetical protein
MISLPSMGRIQYFKLYMRCFCKLYISYAKSNFSYVKFISVILFEMKGETLEERERERERESANVPLL